MWSVVSFKGSTICFGTPIHRNLHYHTVGWHKPWTYEKCCHVRVFVRVTIQVQSVVFLLLSLLRASPDLMWFDHLAIVLCMCYLHVSFTLLCYFYCVLCDPSLSVGLLLSNITSLLPSVLYPLCSAVQFLSLSYLTLSLPLNHNISLLSCHGKSIVVLFTHDSPDLRANISEHHRRTTIYFVFFPFSFKYSQRAPQRNLFFFPLLLFTALYFIT